MHVLVAAHDYYPDPGSGGTGRYVHETAKRFVRRGHDVSVVTRRRGDVPPRERVGGVDVYRYDLSIAERAGPAVLARLPRAAAAVDRGVTAATRRAGTPDVVSFQGPATSLLVDRAVGGDPLRVATVHSPWPTEYRVKTRGPEGAAGTRRTVNVRLRRFLEGCLLGRADHVVTLSRYMLDVVERVYGRAPPGTVVPGGVDAERFTPHGPTDGRVDGDPAFLTVRRLSARMGHETLLSAFADVVERRPGARLYLAGDGPLRGRLERIARAEGVDDVTTFLGYVHDDDLPAVYRSADMFVLPTAELEGFGLATLEALASGLPVVATPVGGTVELLSDLERSVPAPMLVEDADAGSLASAMIAWADRPGPEVEAAGRTCRGYARERYSWDVTVGRLVSLYEDLAADGDRGPRRVAVPASPE